MFKFKRNGPLMPLAESAIHMKLTNEDIQDVFDRIAEASAAALGQTYVELQVASILNGVIDIAPMATITTNKTSTEVTER